MSFFAFFSFVLSTNKKLTETEAKSKLHRLPKEKNPMTDATKNTSMPNCIMYYREIFDIEFTFFWSALPVNWARKRVYEYSLWILF